MGLCLAGFAIIITELLVGTSTLIFFFFLLGVCFCDLPAHHSGVVYVFHVNLGLLLVDGDKRELITIFREDSDSGLSIRGISGHTEG